MAVGLIPIHSTPGVPARYENRQSSHRLK